MYTPARLAMIPVRRPGTEKLWAGLVSCLVMQVHPALAQVNSSGNTLNTFTDPLKNGLNLITIFGFIAGCVMVMGGFLNAKRDENWKMTVVYGIGVAGAVVLMKALFAMFGGNSAQGIQGF
jgi:hypothetical protein